MTALQILLIEFLIVMGSILLVYGLVYLLTTRDKKRNKKEVDTRKRNKVLHNYDGIQDYDGVADYLKSKRSKN